MVKVALCQTDTVSLPQENVAKMIRMIQQAAERGADVAVFPEDCYFDVDAPREHGEGPEPLDGYFVTQMRAAAENTALTWSRALLSAGRKTESTTTRRFL